MTPFGVELRRLRTQSGLSQELLAAHAGLSPEAVSLLERGRRTPRMSTMRLLADGMQLPRAERAAFYATAHLSEPAPAAPLAYLDEPVGRETEITDLGELVERADTRLVTLLGPAGVGKTRVAVSTVERVAAHFPDGVHWLLVRHGSDGRSLLAGLAAALGLHGATQPSAEQIAEHLQHRSALLVIDNTEDQLAVCADLCRTLLAAAPRTTVVITSRHLTGVPGEVAYPIAPLRHPPVGTPPSELPAYPAAQLFLARAGLGTLDQDEADAVARICARVDGLPLAVELAAARTAVLSVAELADGLDAELDILQTSGPDGSVQLADAMLDLSHRMLSADERLVFERLSVFAGSFSRRAVTAVCGEGFTELQVLDVLSSLIAKSLIARQDAGAPHALFRLLQIVGRYARVRFDAHPDAETVRRRHAEYCRDRVESNAPHLTGPDQNHWLALVDRHLPDFARAIDWSVRNQPEDALRLVGAMGRWCYLRGRYAEARSWARESLRASQHSPVELEVPVLELAGTAAFLQNDYVDAASVLGAVRDLFEALGDRAGVIRTTGRLGAIARERGRYEEAESWYREALRLAESTQDDHEVSTQLNQLAFLAGVRGDVETAETLGREGLVRMRALGDREGLIWSLVSLGTAARYRGDLPGAELLLHQCLDLAEDLSFRKGVAWASNQLGVTARLAGDRQRAAGWQRASLALHRQLGDRWREASVYDELAAIAVGEGDPTQAAGYLARGDRLRAELGVPVPAGELPTREETCRAARAALGTAYEIAGLTAGLGTVAG